MISNKKGIFIVVEGGEGSGKSSQLKRIKEKYGDKIVITREPGGSNYAEEIRNIILKSQFAAQANAKTMFALFWAARADHLKNTILPALQDGKLVISDRFDSSTFAYQIYGQEARELQDFFWQTREFFLDDCIPSLYIYLDVDVETGLKRKSGQGAEETNHFEEKKIDFHNRMKEGMTEFLKNVPNKIIDANKSIDEVFEELDKIVSDFLN